MKFKYKYVGFFLQWLWPFLVSCNNFISCICQEQNNCGFFERKFKHAGKYIQCFWPKAGMFKPIHVQPYLFLWNKLNNILSYIFYIRSEIFIYLFNRIFFWKFGKEEEIKIKAKKWENKIFRRIFTVTLTHVVLKNFSY